MKISVESWDISIEYGEDLPRLFLYLDYAIYAEPRRYSSYVRRNREPIINHLYYHRAYLKCGIGRIGFYLECSFWPFRYVEEPGVTYSEIKKMFVEKVSYRRSYVVSKTDDAKLSDQDRVS
jgi:hypothetical protein